MKSSTQIIRHEFVEAMPDILANGVIYVSIPRALVMHKCFCGCGEEVVTPLSPIDWKLTFDGETISLFPSIGNWKFACGSHYWITNNKVKWAATWSTEKINRVEKKEKKQREDYYTKRTIVKQPKK